MAEKQPLGRSISSSFLSSLVPRWSFRRIGDGYAERWEKRNDDCAAQEGGGRKMRNNACGRALWVVVAVMVMMAGGAGGLTNDGGGTWQYSKNLTILNPGTALTDYQVLVNLTGAAFPTGANASGADVRFTDASGAESSYWIEEWDYANRSALVWVNVTSVPAGASSMRMWYGNPRASSSSNGDTTFEFFDDFSGSLDKWEIGPTEATIENGAMKLSTLMSADVTPIYTKAVISLSDYIVDVNAKAISGHYRIQVYQRYLPSNNNLARFWGSSGGMNYQEYINGWGTNYLFNPTNIVDGEWNKIKVEVIGDNNILSANGLYVGSHSLSTPSLIDGSQNRIGFGEWYTTVYYDDVRVRKYAYPEPTVGSANFNLTGRVLNKTSSLGISGALVKLDAYPQYNATTNLTGDYSMSVPAGTYNVTASAAGYATNTTIVTVSADTVQDFALNAGPRTITVDDSGGADYTRIQDAINSANDGDTILVYSGIYYENVNVNKQLTLHGMDTDDGKPVVNAAGISTAIELSAGWSTLEGFNVINTYNGINVHSNNNVIKNNTISNNFVSDYPIGIYMWNANNNTLSGNNVSFNTNGIFLDSSSNNNTLNNNYVTNNLYGLYIYVSSDNTIYNNFLNNTNNVHFDNYHASANTWNITKIAGSNIVGGSYLGGNFWANPSGTGFSQTCADADSDGICDLPYSLDSNNVDYLPLTYFKQEIKQPAIVSFVPELPVNDIIGAERTFSITVNQPVDIRWLINGTEVFSQTGVTESSYTNTSAALGTWNVTAVASNANGIAMQTWDWNVTRSKVIVENYSISVSTDKNIYERNNPVDISGIIQYDNGTFISNSPVNIEIVVKGFKRTFSAITNETGAYNYEFIPFETEAGNYDLTVTANVNGLIRQSYTNFTINGIIFTSRQTNVGMLKGTSSNIQLVIKNVGESVLHGLSIDINDTNLTDGVSASLIGWSASDLNGGEKKLVNIQIDSPLNSSQEAMFEITVDSQEGSKDRTLVRVILSDGNPQINIDPGLIKLNTNPGIAVIKTITISNTGYGTLKNVRIVPPTRDWIVINSNLTVGDILPKENATFDLLIYPSSNISIGRYIDNLTISSSNYPDLKIWIDVSVISSSSGSPVFHTIDKYLGTNISSSKVTLISQEVPGLTFENISDGTGNAKFQDIPAGKYSYMVSANKYDTTSGVVNIEPSSATGNSVVLSMQSVETNGQVIEVLLNPSWLDVAFYVTPNTIPDKYNVTLEMTLDAKVPIPVLQAIPDRLSYTLTPGSTISNQTVDLYNLGLISANNITISTGTNSGVHINLLSDSLSELKAKNKTQIPFDISLDPTTPHGIRIINHINISGEFLYSKDGVEKMVPLNELSIPVYVTVPVGDIDVAPHQAITILEPGETQSSAFTIKNIGPYEIDNIKLTGNPGNNDLSISMPVTEIPALLPGENKSVNYIVSVSENSSWNKTIYNFINISGIENTTFREMSTNFGILIEIPDRVAQLSGSSLSYTIEPGDYIYPEVIIKNTVFINSGGVVKNVPVKDIGINYSIGSTDVNVNEITVEGTGGLHIDLLNPGEEKIIALNISASNSSKRGETTSIVIEYAGKYTDNNNEIRDVTGKSTIDITIPEKGLLVNPSSLVMGHTLDIKSYIDANTNQTMYNVTKLYDEDTHYFTITNPHKDLVYLAPPDNFTDPELIPHDLIYENLIWGKVPKKFINLLDIINYIISPSNIPEGLIKGFGFSVTTFDNGTFIKNNYYNTSLNYNESTQLKVHSKSFYADLWPTVEEGYIHFNYRWAENTESQIKEIPVYKADIGLMGRLILLYGEYCLNTKNCSTYIPRLPPLPPTVTQNAYSIDYGPKVSEYTEARVKIQLSQELTLEREAFEASTQLSNKLDSDLRNISVSINIENESGINSNDKFFIQPPTLSNINSINGDGIINSLSTSSINWIIIPKTDSGGIAESGQNYTVQLNINGNVNGAPFTANSEQVKITVKPQPKLNLTYYLPKEIVANQPFHLAVKVNNSGYGWARNLKIDSAQPEIMENNASLFLDFAISSSLLVDFGDIAPGEEKIKYWTLESSVPGKFSNFSASFTHSEILGGEATSLITGVNTELLDRELYINGMDVPYLKDSNKDNKPDSIIDLASNREFTLEDANISSIKPDAANLTQNVLISKPQNQWVNIEVPDIFNGDRAIKSIYRSDGAVINPRNYWIENGKIIIIDDPDMDYIINYDATAVLPPAPSLIGFAPSSPVYDIAGASRTFNITVNQSVNVTWYLNGTQVGFNDGVTDASYTNSSASEGFWNVTAIATNTSTGLSASQTWDWYVTTSPLPPPGTPNITSFAPLSPVSDTVGAKRTFNITVNQTVNITWHVNGTLAKDNGSVPADTLVNHTNTSAAAGFWNVTAIAQNANGTASKEWLWIVSKANTTTAITTISPEPSVVGQNYTVNFTVTINSPGSRIPTGTVTVDDGNGNSCSASVAAGGCSVASISSGTKTLNAFYAGDSNFNASSATVPHNVSKADTATKITLVSPEPSVVNQSYAVNWTVTVNPPGGGDSTGIVTVNDGGGNICSAPISTNGCSLISTSTEIKTLNANYSGDSNFNVSSNTTSHQVNTRVTATIVSFGTNPVVVGQPSVATLAIEDIENNGTKSNPAGIVNLTSNISSDIFTPMAGCSLVAGGMAAANCSVTITAQNAGVHNIAASYPSDSVHSASNGNIGLTVNKADTSTAITSSINPSVSGESVTFTVHITAVAPGAGLPIGTVLFNDSGVTIGTGMLNASGQANFSTSSLSIASHSITAAYLGDGNFNNSTSSALYQIVNQSATPSIISWSNSKTNDQSLTLTTNTTETVNFNITVNQIVNVTWYINGTLKQTDISMTNSSYTNSSYTNSSYTNTSVSAGFWNVTAIAINNNGTASQKWLWNVTSLPKGATAILLTPNKGPSGTNVGVNGSGFNKNKAIAITFNGSTVPTSPSSCISDTNGNFTCSFTVPTITPSSYKVQASDGTNTASATFKVTKR